MRCGVTWTLPSSSSPPRGVKGRGSLGDGGSDVPRPERALRRHWMSQFPTTDRVFGDSAHCRLRGEWLKITWGMIGAAKRTSKGAEPNEANEKEA